MAGVMATKLNRHHNHDLLQTKFVDTDMNSDDFDDITNMSTEEGW